MKELSKATDSLACGKAPGKDSMLPEVIEAAKELFFFPRPVRVPAAAAVLGRRNRAPGNARRQHHRPI